MSYAISSAEPSVTLGDAIMFGRRWVVSPPALDDATYTTRNAGKTRQVDAWLGIQYAQHPVGARRWSAAVDHDYPAGRHWLARWPDTSPGNERTAWLSLWRPATVTVPMPVIVWVHPAGRTAMDDDTLGHLQAAGGAVVVSVEYPSGPFGSWWHPDEGVTDSATSYILSALRWVQRHVATFGGDPAKVLLIGGAEAVRAAEDAPGLYTAIWAVGVDALAERWSAAPSNDAPGYKRAYGHLLAALRASAGALAAASEDRPAARAPHHYVDANRILRDPDGARFICRGVQMFPYLFTMHEFRADYRYRTRFGKVTRPDGSEIASGPATGISEPTYIAKQAWVSGTWAEDQIDRARQLGVNIIQVGMEPAIRYTIPYRDPIDGRDYPSELQMLDQIIDAATARDMVVELRQSNDQLPGAVNVEFLGWLGARYKARRNIWINPSNEHGCFGLRQPDGSLVPNPHCADPVVWSAQIAEYITAIRASGFTAPIVICTTSYSGTITNVLPWLEAGPAFANDPNIVIGAHHYKANADVDFETSRKALTESRWAPGIDGRYCTIVEESGVNNLGIMNLDPQLNPPNPSSEPAEWADTAKYFEQFLAWTNGLIEDGRLNGFIAFNWGSWSGSRNRDNGLTRIGTDGALTAWGDLYRDHYLTAAHGARFDRLSDAIATLGEASALRRHLSGAAILAAGVAAPNGIAGSYQTVVDAAAAGAFPVPMAVALGPISGTATDRDAVRLGYAGGAGEWARNPANAGRDLATDARALWPCGQLVAAQAAQGRESWALVTAADPVPLLLGTASNVEQMRLAEAMMRLARRLLAGGGFTWSGFDLFDDPLTLAPEAGGVSLSGATLAPAAMPNIREIE
ncbi:carboxylesterase family protein [Paracoccus jiaweipingae]|uniref:carboxylesterase family protein n=1 Tax=Paracoccus sp. p2-l61 TaxID=3366950 RepID=UPI0037BD0607